MSYILDALRKAERERHLGQTPDLRTLYGPIQPPQGRRLWPWLLAGLVMVNATGLMVLWLLHDGDAAATSTVVATDSATGSMPAAAAPVVAAPAAALATAPVLTLTPSSAAPAESVRLPAPPSAPVAMAAAAAPARQDALPPPLAAMPANFRQTLPALNLDVHVYSEAPERRFVMINSLQYRIGDTLREGPQLDDIVEEGAVLSFLGQRFLLPVSR
ncbi:MAG TPA: general secretion pathway protein GspB [Candidatus Competibacteraceae bacterium]|nr:general secretion pathway protein GspB [Candidatus Competibacteraceae bacterium]